MQSQSHNPDVILASSSVYKKLLLERLNLDFVVLSPDIDERPLEQEAPEHLVVRLAQEKARAVSEQFPAALVIGSDQLAVFENNIIGKPGTGDAAVRQLHRFSGKCVQFLTAVRLCCTASGFDAGSMILTEVIFRELSDQEIQRYVKLDRPLDCAGGFKAEAAGISLLKSMRSQDPTAIVGLPLITVSALLREAGFEVP
jgi:septum formation protein